MQLAIENVDQAGGCSYGYACVYMDTISWASPTSPLPMIRDPRLAFDQLFGSGGTPEKRAARRRAQQSILDWIPDEVARLKRRPRIRKTAAVSTITWRTSGRSSGESRKSRSATRAP